MFPSLPFQWRRQDLLRGREKLEIRSLQGRVQQRLDD